MKLSRQEVVAAADRAEQPRPRKIEDAHLADIIKRAEKRSKDRRDQVASMVDAVTPEMLREMDFIDWQTN